MNLVALILTHNEERHIERCIKSVHAVTSDVVVVDSFSTDETTAIAQRLGADVMNRAWVSYSNQFNWALGQLDPDTEWVLRIDADEYLGPELVEEIGSELTEVEPGVAGISVLRSLVFQGKKIRWGGVYPVRTIRLMRLGHGACENRWINAELSVTGSVRQFQGNLVDENLDPLSQWIEDHNRYASREAVDLLSAEYGLLNAGKNEPPIKPSRKQQNNLLKNMYFGMPLGIRAFVFFFYRFILRLGFLDGRKGMTFHFLQGFWYRFLVDAKVQEVKSLMNRENIDAEKAIEAALGILVWRLRNSAAFDVQDKSSEQGQQND